MNFFRIYILPGLIFQSVIIGGGYATGRELVQFFFASGPIGGVLGLLVAGVIFAVVIAVGFEFSRVMRAYDYRHFCRKLLGRGWFIFEIAYIIQLLLVLSVIGSASGKLTESVFGIPPLIGTLGLMVMIGIMTFNGSEFIKKILAGWSVVLYAVYLILFVYAFKNFGGEIGQVYADAPIGEGWLSGGILYSGYNLAVIPAILFAVSTHKSRRETIGAGLFAGAIGVIPAILFFIAMMSQYPIIGDQPVPATYLMSALNIGWLALIFQIVVFGTFVETGAALLHAVNERIAGSFAEQGRTLPRSVRPLVSISFLIIAIFVAEKIGIVNLIAQGYSLLTVVFIVIFIIPLMTFGIWKILHSPAEEAVSPLAAPENSD